MMNEPSSWDHSRHDLQGILPTPSHDSLTAPIAVDLALSDPTALLGLQLGSDPTNLPRGHASLPHWLPSHPPSLPPSSSSTTIPDYAPYHVPRRTCNQDAWNPLQVTGVPANPTAWGLQPIPADLHGKYPKCQQSAPSASGSLQRSIHPSDSGYGTQTCTTRSVTNSSYAVDASCSPQLAPRHEPELVEDKHEARAGQELIKCDYPNCRWVGKCPSDKKKHEARHRKSFRCDEPNCNRKEGFGTINDLARHKKCVHKQEPVRGPKVLYMCFGRNCPRRNKQWPRLDNFKQHLARMHSGENATELLKKSNEWYQEFITTQEESVVDYFSRDESEVFGIHQPQESEEVPMDFFADRYAAVTSTNSDDLRSSESLNPSQTLSANGDHRDQKLSRHEYSSSPAQPPPSNLPLPPVDLPAFKPFNITQSLVQTHAASSQAETPRNEKTEDVVSEAAANVINVMTKVINSKKRRESQQTDEVDIADPNPELCDRKKELLQKIFLAAVDRLSTDSRPKSEDPSCQVVSDPESEASKEDCLKCEFCPKRTRLRCEMKKHQKRHERPYGCTFDRCIKTFGSKADWKRHESSQHIHLRSWRCTLQDPDKTNISCARLFPRQEMYAQHLRKQHHVDENAVQTYLGKNRLGQDGQPQFWCGFCRAIVPVRSRGLAAWSERFSHIDSQHFKKGDRIGDWLPASGHLTKKQIHEIEATTEETSEGGDGSDESLRSSSSSPSDEEDASHEAPTTLTRTNTLKRKSSVGKSPTAEKRPMVQSDEAARNTREILKVPEHSLSIRPAPDFVYCCQCRNVLGNMAQCFFCPHTLCDGCQGRNNFSGDGGLRSNTS